MDKYMSPSESGSVNKIVGLREELSQVLFGRIFGLDQEVLFVLEDFFGPVVDGQDMSNFEAVQLLGILGIAQIADIKSGKNLKYVIHDFMVRTEANVVLYACV